MKVTVDTNIIVRVARADDDPTEAGVARRILASAAAVVLPIHVLCEFDWVMRKRYRRPRAEVVASLQAILLAPNLIVDRDAAAAGLAFLAAGGDFADGVIAFDGQRLGGEVFASFDAKAKRIAALAGYAVI